MLQNFMVICLWFSTVCSLNPLLLVKNNTHDLAPRETTSCSDRKTAGLICESCDRLAYCVQINNNWNTYPVEQCENDKGLFCNIYDRNCSTNPGPCNRLGYEGNFACTSEGIYPDPYDCQKYHMCFSTESSNPVVGSADCPGHRAYSVITSDCSLTVSDTVCKEKQYKCNKSGDSGAWPNNPNIFYICQPTLNVNGERFYYPTLYRCAPGEIYNGYNCIINDGPVTTSKTTNNPIVSTTQDSTETTIPPEISCTHEIGLKKDPKDCRSYYYCPSRKSSPMHYKCPTSTYFNENSLSCVIGEC